jgi:hypothetical protein
MKILYAVANHPQLSEGYVESEIRFAEQSGIEVAVWSKRPPGAPYPITRKVYEGELSAAESDFKPDFVHFHWLTFAAGNLAEVNTPVTIRGHSFDYDVNRINKLCALEKVKGIFLFPHQAATVSHAKVIPMKVGYDSSRYSLELNKNRRQVVRCCAARPMKGLFDFISVAKLCPDFDFNLCVAEIAGAGSFVPNLNEFKDKENSPAKIKVSVQPDEMTRLMRTSGIHLHSLDLPQNVGMCISVAEGMACGNYTIVRDTVPLTQMIAGVGNTYNTVAEAAKFVNDTKSWDDKKWKDVADSTALQALQFADFNVFPTLIQKWNEA